MANKNSKKISEKDVKKNLEEMPDVVTSQIPVTESDTVLDNVIATQEQVSNDVLNRLEDMGNKDTAGQIFNADIHAVGNDGKPSITSGGKYRLKKKRKEVLTDEDVERKTVAETSAGLFIQLGVVIFGDEWLPENNEAEQLVTAFDNYYKSAGIAYIPPSIGLCVAMGGYSLKRIAKPNTKSRLGKVKDAIKNRIFKLFGWKPKKKTNDEIRI